MLNALTRLWSPVEVRREVPARPEVVYDLLAAPRTYPDWLVGNQRMRAVDADFPEPGSELHHSVGPAGAATVDDVSEVLAAEPHERLELLVKAGPMRAVVVFEVRPAGDGTEVRFRERPVGWMSALTPLLRPVLHARNTESMRRLADLVAGGVTDSGSPPAAPPAG